MGDPNILSVKCIQSATKYSTLNSGILTQTSNLEFDCLPSELVGLHTGRPDPRARQVWEYRLDLVSSVEAT